MDMKVDGMENKRDEKVEEIKELNYSGVKAMPFVIGIYMYMYILKLINIHDI